MNKQPEITDRTRGTLISAFCKLYQQKPIERITILEITRAAGYNRSTFYQYFRDIYDVLEYIENDVLEYIREKAKEHTDDVQGILALFEAKGEYLSALLCDYGNNRFIERLKEVLPDEAIAMGLPKKHPLTPYLMEFQFSTKLAMFRLWQSRGRDLPLDDFIALIYNLNTGGIKAAGVI